ncbi:MAG: SDR family NAD(P)-dependent oxidoreductase [Pseudomonadota bacterium]|nr:SDR family NAD(P)-dependent oxidoreductase [Pseudomonadota bacterium]
MAEATVALVTGANRGIGLEVARQLAARGIVILLGARDSAKAENAARSLAGEVHPLRLDVADAASIAAVAAEVARDHERLDILVNNAGVHYDTHEHASDADLDGIVAEALATNLLGPWRVTQALLPLLRCSAHPRIVNVSSEGGSLASMGNGPPAYQVSKAALNALTRTFAGELPPPFKVNAVCPGWVETDMGGHGGRPVREGAAGIVWAATLADDGPTGGFFRDERPLPW